MKHAYHGSVGSSANLTNTGTWNASFRGGFEFDRFAWPHTYRGAHQDVDSLVRDAEESLTSAQNENKIAGWIFEPIQGVGGLNPLPEGYAPRVA